MNSLLKLIYRKIRHRIRGWKIYIQATRKPLKVVIGASGVYESGWIATDIDHLNILASDDWAKHFRANSIDVILAEHVWEHLTHEEAYLAAINCYQYLKPNGYIRIAVPDGFHISADYVNKVKPGGTGAGSGDHKVLYNYKTLSHVFEAAKFDVELLEYFDEKGNFQSKEWNPQKGLIHRSSKYDERNKDGQLNYTSIIIDAHKR